MLPCQVEFGIIEIDESRDEYESNNRQRRFFN